jgi:hypothetical protein
MSDVSEVVKPRNRKGKREPTSLHVDPSLWQEVRVMAVLKGVSVTEYFEDALRRKIDADNLEAGREGYKVGHGGMYIPPPPATQPQDQKQQSQPHEQKPDLFSSDNAKIDYQGYDQFCAEVWLPGLKFPTNTKELVKFHWDNIEKSFDKRPLYKFKEKFANLNKEYRNKEELEEDLRMIHDKDRLSKRWNQKLMTCIVVVDKDKNVASQNFIDEMMKRMSVDGQLSGKLRNEIDQHYAKKKVIQDNPKP